MGRLNSRGSVSEQYLLGLEREAMVSLCGEPKSLERMHSILFKRKTIKKLKIYEAYIISGKRSPVGKAKKGGLRFTRPDDLAADNNKKPSFKE